VGERVLICGGRRVVESLRVERKKTTERSRGGGTRKAQKVEGARKWELYNHYQHKKTTQSIKQKKKQ